MQARRFERVSERLGNKKARPTAQAAFCACAFFYGLSYAKENVELSQYEKELLTNPHLSNVELQQKKI